MHKMSSQELADKTFQKWKKQAHQYQEGYYNVFGDRIWDCISDKEVLKQRIGFALFGLPKYFNTTSFNYNREQDDIINSVTNLITSLKQKNSTVNGFSPVLIAFIYVNLLLENENEEEVNVLFRISEDNINLFVDSTCRIYYGWDDYLENNKLPKCFMCYPRNGIYGKENGSLKISFKKSPACKPLAALLADLDTASNIVSAGSACVAIASFIVPVAAPILWGATAAYISSSAYCTTRSAATLIEKSQRNESLSLTNTDSRKAWIDLAANATGIVSVGTSAVVRKLARKQLVMSPGCKTALNVLRTSSAVFNGIGVLHSLSIVVTKFLNGTFEKSDVFYFKEALAFFLNAIVSFELATNLIGVISTNNNTELFHIAENRCFLPIKSTGLYTLNQIRVMVLGKASKIMPHTSNVLNLKQHVEKLLSLKSELKDGRKSLDEFLFEFIDVLRDICAMCRDSFYKSLQELRCLFKIVDLSSCSLRNGYKPFQESNLEDVNQFCMILHETIQHCGVNDDVKNHEKLLDLINTFNDEYPLNINTAHFLEKSRFICDFLIKKFDEIQEKEGLISNRTKDYIDKLLCAKNFKSAVEETNINTVLRDYKCFLSKNTSKYGDGALTDTNGIITYAYGPVDSKKMTEEYYWQKANSRTKLNKNNSVLMAKPGIVYIRPVNIENCDFNLITFYESYYEAFVMGIMCVVKNIHDDKK